jgi:hypothetical protein
VQYYKNTTYEELLEFGTYLIENFSEAKEEDLILIEKYKEIIQNPMYDISWFSYIEGWVSGLSIKYGIKLETWVRREKIRKIDRSTN